MAPPLPRPPQMSVVRYMVQGYEPHAFYPETFAKFSDAWRFASATYKAHGWKIMHPGPTECFEAYEYNELYVMYFHVAAMDIRHYLPNGDVGPLKTYYAKIVRYIWKATDEADDFKEHHDKMEAREAMEEAMEEALQEAREAMEVETPNVLDVAFCEDSSVDSDGDEIPTLIHIRDIRFKLCMCDDDMPELEPAA